MPTTDEIKIKISRNCSICSGDGCLPDGKGKTYDGVEFDRYKPCPPCNGTGREAIWITLPQLNKLMTEVIVPVNDLQEIRESIGLGR